MLTREQKDQFEKVQLSLQDLVTRQAGCSKPWKNPDSKIVIRVADDKCFTVPAYDIFTSAHMNPRYQNTPRGVRLSSINYARVCERAVCNKVRIYTHHHGPPYYIGRVSAACCCVCARAGVLDIISYDV